MPVHTGRHSHGKATQGGVYGPQQYPAPAAGRSGARMAQLSPDAAATRIQTAWRKARIAKQQPAINALAAAAVQLEKVTDKFHKVQQDLQGMPLDQKQYLCLSELVMKVLFDLDAVKCGSSTELRARRKELSTRANALLDEIQAAHKAKPAAAHSAAHQQQEKPKRTSWFRR